MTTNHSGIVEKTFRSGEVHLNYAEGPVGGPPLVLLHGLGRRWQIFQPLMTALSLHWHVFALDLRGHGKSSRVARGYHGAQYGQDIARFLRERIAAPTVLFGHSLGGMIAMWVAFHHPELVRAVILGDNMIVAQRLQDPMYQALFAGLRDVVRAGGPVEQVANGIGQIMLPLAGSRRWVSIRDLPGNDAAYLLSWADCVRHADPDAYEMTLDGSSLEGWDGEAALRGIRCPTLLLQASSELGGLMSDADVALAMCLLPNPTHVKFDTLGHGLFIQQLQPVVAAVTSFLESL